MFSDTNKDQNIGECKIVIKTPEPVEAFDLRELLLKEILKVARKSRSTSC